LIINVKLMKAIHPESPYFLEVECLMPLVIGFNTKMFFSKENPRAGKYK